MVLLDVDAEAVRGTADDAEAAGAEAMALACDVSDRAAVEDAFAPTLDRFGRLDALVNNAVVGPETIAPDFLVDPRRFWEIEDSVWERMLRVNLFGPQLVTKTVVGHMIERGTGRIVNVTTSLDTMYRSGVGAYGPTKAGFEALSRIMAQDLEGTGVTVNVLVPGGPAATRMFAGLPGVPKDKLISPAVMVDPVVWPCSGASDGVSGYRFLAVKWDPSLDPAALVARAGAPIPWPQLGAQAVNPDDFPSDRRG